MPLPVRIALSLVVCAALVSGCKSRTVVAPRDEATFGPVSMRLHPVFSRAKDFDGDDKLDGIEAMLEFQDAFGDPTKASGRVIFELFELRANQPDPRGRRVVNPWLGSLMTLEDQNERWNRASRAYLFPLDFPRAGEPGDYVLTAQFDTSDGRRFFDRLILQRRQEK